MGAHEDLRDVLADACFRDILDECDLAFLNAVSRVGDPADGLRRRIDALFDVRGNRLLRDVARRAAPHFTRADRSTPRRAS